MFCEMNKTLPSIYISVMLKTPHLDPLRAKLRSLKLVQPPSPWREIAIVSVGGLRAVGFDRESDLLLVVSFAGRGVIDCLTGQRIARDDANYFEDTTFLEAEGIGLLKGHTLRVTGLHGGGLPITTEDGWSVKILGREWPELEVLMIEPNASLYASPPREPSGFHKVAVESELRACGFSYTGRTLIVASSSDIIIFGRDSVNYAPESAVVSE